MLTTPRLRWGIAIVRGHSMQPTLNEGDRLLIRYGKQPRLGEIAVVDFDGRMVVKRLELRTGDEWWFSRDNPAEGVDSWTRGMPSVTSEIFGTAVARLWPRFRRL